MGVSPHGLKRKANGALKEADRLGLNLKPYPNKSGYKWIRKHYDNFIAEVGGRLVQNTHGGYHAAVLGRFETAEEAALALAKHLANIENLRKMGTKDTSIDVEAHVA